MILVWNHSYHISPTWYCDSLEYFQKGKRFISSGFTRHQIACHIQEVPENGADVAHLNIVHSAFVFKILNYFGFTHYWQGNWRACEEPVPHLAKIDIVESMKFRGMEIPCLL